MSTWDLIEKAVMAQPVAVPLSRREIYVVKEAHASWVKTTLDEASAWDVLENIKILMETNEGFMDMFKGKPSSEPEKIGLNRPHSETTAVKGLTPREVQLVRNFKGNAKSKTGETGEIMALSPKEWLKIKQEIQKQPEYYDKLLGDVETSKNLVKKIEDKLALVMGQGPSKLLAPDIKPPKDLHGNPGDPTDIQTGAAQYGNEIPVKQPDIGALGQTGGGSPFAKRTGSAAGAPPNTLSGPAPESPEARRRRVAAQDMQSMGAKNKDELDKITGSGKVKA